MAKPLLSIGMIVKNEIRCIERCLKALQPLRERIPCELVIADTGSTDGTREIVQQYADICFDFEWIGDFSAARNAVLDRCSGKWALTVDADEYLDPDFSQLTEFLTDKRNKRYRWGAVNIISYPDFEMRGAETDFLALRLARMDMQPRYSGIIHESFPDVRADQCKPLIDVRFHHDGYANNAGHFLKKMERNLALLQKELKNSPDDLKLLLQAVESSGHLPAQQIEYLRRAMKVLESQTFTSAGKQFGPVLCCHALEEATKQKMPELEKWEELSATAYPDAIFLRLDGNFILTKYYFEEKQYDKVPGYVNAFLSAWNDFQKRHFDPIELMFSVLRCVGRRYEAFIRSAGCEALGRLGRTAEAADLLVQEPDWEGLEPNELYSLLVSATWSAGEEKMQRVVADMAAAVEEVSGSGGAGLWQAFCSVANAAFRKCNADEDTPEYPWRLFRQVDGTLGQATRLMEAKSIEMQEILPCIEVWEDVPDQAVIQVVEQGVELPEDFYAQSKERLSDLAAALCRSLPSDDLLDWIDQWDFTSSMAKFQFLFVLLGAMMQAKKTWDDDTSVQAPLCKKFVDIAAGYLPSYYNPDLLSDINEWKTLPSPHRFALCLLQGRAALEQGDQIGYIHALRDALKASPYMKEAVKYLQAHPIWLVIAPELKLLAEQVKTILAQYRSDDPAVTALKQSEAYQKVAYLIEGMSAPVC